MPRKRFSEQQVIETMWHQGVVIVCYRCRGVVQPVVLGAEGSYYFPVQREHLHEIALGGPDIPANCRYSHIECHKIVTDGSPASSVGSSKHRIAKVKRIQAGGKKRKGRKIPSRPFQKRAKP